jgi:opacity protein-like surface antigen
MGSVKKLALAGTAALLSTTAFAADLSLPPPAAPLVRPAPIVETGGWYLRGDVGIGMQNFKSFDFTQTNAASGAVWPASWRIDQKDIGDSSFVGFGVGYAWNNWFRFDVTGEYRGKAKFKAIGSYEEFCAPGTRCFDLYDGNHSAAVFLANAYIDLGTWWCITPFVGAGVGMAYNRITGLSDQGIGTSSPDGGITLSPISALGYTSADKSQWNMAWAVHAGLAYNVSNNFKIEFAYRYLNLGNVATSEVLCGGGGCGTGSGPRAFYTLHQLDSQELKIGFRWMLAPEPVVAAPMPIYSPPPPLMRRG